MNLDKFDYPFSKFKAKYLNGAMMARQTVRFINEMFRENNKLMKEIHETNKKNLEMNMTLAEKWGIL